jgi:hypothetical protein
VRRLRRLSTLENGNKLKGRLTLNEVRWAPAVRCLKKWIRDGVQKKRDRTATVTTKNRYLQCIYFQNIDSKEII